MKKQNYISIFLIILMLVLTCSGCSTMATISNDTTVTNKDNITNVNNIKFEFITETNEHDVPRTTVLLVIDNDTTRRMYVGKYIATFYKLDPNMKDSWGTMENSLISYVGWYAGGGAILSLVKEDNGYAVYEKLIGESKNPQENEFIKVTSIITDNNKVEILDSKDDTTANANDSSEITESNWLNHPKIKEIRGIYNVIQNSITTNEFKSETKEIKLETPKFKAITKFSDSNNIIRKYIKQGGSEDSAHSVSYYFSTSKKLRFVLLSVRATNGTNLEYRLYYDEQGNKIWENKSLIKGPGYPVKPDDFITTTDYDAIIE